ncbi:serum amyloid A-5 protein-like [Acanthaster planci]|uniref:Serum amyloid A-5 protein-like n=1 Tax=Acanthaster planci TaxID=133434 RepID=A0A8B7ZNN6_ACAPL|nr:serum amyloid A-5 protein-like [Acanthaster planci]
MNYNVVALLVLGVLVMPSSAWPDWFDRARDFVSQAWQGADDMYQAYNDMREANYIGSDKYFHARGNYDAAQRGPGGAWVAEVISNAREGWQGASGRGAEDTRADQEANEWGRSGGDPNIFRPEGLPDRY